MSGSHLRRFAVAALASAFAVGGATALAAPALPDQASETALEKTSTERPALPDTAADAAAEATATAAETVEEAETDAAKEDAGEAAKQGADTASATHGAVVSDFARTTELEGREKGQAIADVARGGEPGERNDAAAAERGAGDDGADDVADDADSGSEED